MKPMYLHPEMHRKLAGGIEVDYDPLTRCFFLWEGGDAIEVIDTVTGETPYVFRIEGGVEGEERPDMASYRLAWRHRLLDLPISGCECEDCAAAVGVRL